MKSTEVRGEDREHEASLGVETENPCVAQVDLVAFTLHPMHTWSPIA